MAKSLSYGEPYSVLVSKHLCSLEPEEAENLASLLTRNPYCLAKIYELLLDSHARFQNGIIYTPPQLAEQAVRLSLPYLTKERLDILDPACGAGILLLETLHLTGKRINSLAACDRDPIAILLAKHLIPGCFSDGTKVEIGLVEDALFHYPSDKRFDFIIMNPPYGTFRSREIAKSMKHKLRDEFAKEAGGKFNTYIAFVLKFLCHLAPNGVLTAIIPNAWLGIDDGAGLRRELLTSRQLREVFSSSAITFKDAGVESIIMVAKNCESADHFLVTSDSGSKKHRFADYSTNDNPIQIHATNSLKGFGQGDSFVALDQLSNLFEPRIALQAYRLGGGTPPQTAEVVKSHPFHHSSPRANSLRYLAGRDVDRYRSGWSGEYLEYGPWLAECPERSRFTGPRIIVREVLGTLPHLIRATYIEEPAVYNRSVLQIKLVDPENNTDRLLALLGYLNSAIVSLHLLEVGRKSARALFPKLVIKDLKELPIPLGIIEAPAELAKLVRRRLQGSAQNIETLKLDREIDLYVLERSAPAVSLDCLYREVSQIFTSRRKIEDLNSTTNTYEPFSGVQK